MSWHHHHHPVCVLRQLQRGIIAKQVDDFNSSLIVSFCVFQTTAIEDTPLSLLLKLIIALAQLTSEQLTIQPTACSASSLHNIHMHVPYIAVVVAIEVSEGRTRSLRQGHHRCGCRIPKLGFHIVMHTGMATVGIGLHIEPEVVVTSIKCGAVQGVCLWVIFTVEQIWRNQVLRQGIRVKGRNILYTRSVRYLYLHIRNVL